MDKLTFTSPRTASAHISLLEAISQAGLDRDALRRLLWLINAHPRLIGHARIFKQIGELLSSNRFSQDNLRWAQPWVGYLPAWIELCNWIWNKRRELRLWPGLSEIDAQPSSYFDHPILGEGIIRHAVVGALWCQFPSKASESQSILFEGLSPERFRILQGHILAFQCDCRFRLSTLEFYESYDGYEERPIAPVHTAQLGRAVRKLCAEPYAAVIGQFPVVDASPDYARAIESMQIDISGIQEEMAAVAERAIAQIRLYFSRFFRMQRGWTPSQDLLPRTPSPHKRSHPGLKKTRAPGVFRECATLSFKGVIDQLTHLDVALAAVCLGVFLFAADDGFPDQDQAPLKIHEFPFEPIDFAGAHAGEKPNSEVVAEVCANGLEYRFDFIQREWLDVCAFHFQLLDVVERCAEVEAVSCLVEDLPEGIQDLVDPGCRKRGLLPPCDGFAEFCSEGEHLGLANLADRLVSEFWEQGFVERCPNGFLVRTPPLDFLFLVPDLSEFSKERS